MRRLLAYVTLTALPMLMVMASFAQSVTIRGTIKNSASQETIPAVSVLIKGTSEGTYTDDRGNFSISTSKKLPITLEISAIGFESKSVTVSKAENVAVSLTPASTLGQEVVVSATRTPSRIMESPVTIERMRLITISWLRSKAWVW